MRAILTSLVAAVVFILGAGPAGAQPAITTCALTGVYVLSAALAVSGEAQFSGSFTFTPGACTAGAFGTVQLQLSILFAGSPTPSPFTGSFPYAVDATGGVTIGPGLIQGNVGGVAETGTANVVVFAADPAISPATIRFAGTAVRVGLIGVAGPPGPAGTLVFTLLGGNPPFTVPSGITSLVVEAFGAGGAGASVIQGGLGGGGGGYVRAVVTGVSGQSLTVFVGGGECPGDTTLTGSQSGLLVSAGGGTCGAFGQAGGAVSTPGAAVVIQAQNGGAGSGSLGGTSGLMGGIAGRGGETEAAVDRPVGPGS